jgi:hypothetical protein
MKGHLEALLEMDFCTKPPKFGVEAHMEAPAGDALTYEAKCEGLRQVQYCSSLTSQFVNYRIIYVIK